VSAVRRFVLTLLLLFLASPAHAALDKWTLEAMAGTYRVDCAKADGPSVVIEADAFTFVDGTTKVVAKNLESAASWYGQNTPDAEEYRTVILSRENDDPHLLLTLFEDTKGYYLQLGSAHDDAIKTYGASLVGKTFRRCLDSPKPETPKAGAAPAKTATPAVTKPDPTAPTKLAEPDTAGFVEPLESGGAALRMKEKPFREAYAKAMGPFMKHRWLAVLDGPSPAGRTATVAGEERELVAACKAGECAENAMLVAFSAKKKNTVGVARIAGVNELVGAPSPAQAEDLLRLFEETWRPGSIRK